VPMASNVSKMPRVSQWLMQELVTMSCSAASTNHHCPAHCPLSMLGLKVL
jgi:hypothetical protein